MNEREHDVYGARKKRRFSRDTINDLIFWGIHLCIVAISLTIVWTKIERTNVSLALILRTQQDQLKMLNGQLQAAERQTILAENAEAEKEEQTKATRAALDTILDNVSQMHADVIKDMQDAGRLRQLVINNVDRVQQEIVKTVKDAAASIDKVLQDEVKMHTDTEKTVRENRQIIIELMRHSTGPPTTPEGDRKQPPSPSPSPPPS